MGNFRPYLMAALLLLGINMSASISTSASSELDSKREDRIKAALQKPLIIGASVSGDYLTESPGKRLALRYTKKD
ncbi:MAG: hypothetical protein EOP06_27585, partial [Proteobacteria bacterium]